MDIVLPNPVKTAIEHLSAHGYRAYLVGGCVRDSLRGESPQDWDLAVSALPQELLALFGGFPVLPTGVEHGTVTAVIGGMPIEMTTFRADGPYSDGRRPDSVRLGACIEEDLARRDLTVNAMAYHPQEGLVDPFGGRNDLARGILRCVGDPSRRFREDALRILRLLRFGAVLGFTIEEKTAAAAAGWAPRLSQIAAERVREELCKLLCGENCAPMFLQFPQILGVILPELLPCIGFFPCNWPHSWDLYTHLARSVPLIRPHPTLRMAMLLHGIGEAHLPDGAEGSHRPALISAQTGEAILSRLRFPTTQREEIGELLRHHPLSGPASDSQVSRQLAQLTPQRFFSLLEMGRADLLAQPVPPNPRQLEELDQLKSQAQSLLSQGVCLSLRDLRLDGRDLMALGLSPGPRMGQILRALWEGVLDGMYPNESPALKAAAACLMRQGEENECL